MAQQAKLRIGTRASALARWQADWVAGQLQAAGAAVEIVFIQTTGDQRTGPLGQIGGEGLFTKRIQEALLHGQIDVAVHSLKDLPTEGIAGLRVGAVPPRAAISDVLVCRTADSLDGLASGAVVGTGSMRRRAQLLHRRPDLHVEDLRGNVGTRLKKLEDGQYDAIVLAEAGLRRLGLADRVTQILTPEQMLPAVGQGALGIEIRAEDSATAGIVAQLDDRPTHAAVTAERSMLARLSAGCLAPVGAWGRFREGELHLDAVVLSADGAQRIAARAAGPLDSAAQLGEDVANTLLEQGAAALVAAARAATAAASSDRTGLGPRP